jgi:hypothetical protein
MAQLTQPHIGGVEFFRFPNLKSLGEEHYFDCLQKLSSLLRDVGFNSVTPAFYINYITNPDDNANSLRITYFTIDPSQTVKIIHDFVENNKNKVALFESVWTSRLTSETKLEMPDEEELRFRNFLNDNTKIVLDIIENSDRKSFQELVYKYRHADLPNRVHPRNVFGKMFSESSRYFQELQNENLDGHYWKDLPHLFHGRDFGLHFLVNMMTVEEAPYKREYVEESWIIQL